MNRFFTLLLAASCLTVVGQVEFPWNPDTNDDGIVGAEDLLGLLSVYNGEWELPDPALWATSTINNLLNYEDSLELLSYQLDSIQMSLNEQSEGLDSLESNLSEAISNALDTLAVSLTSELAWSYNREACHFYMNGGTYTAQLECQYIFAAAPNSGGGATTLKLPQEVPHSPYTIHVQAGKSGVIACGTNGTSCPVLTVKTFGGEEIDTINLNQFYSPSGLAVQHRKYIWDNGSWLVVSHAFVGLQLD